MTFTQKYRGDGTTTNQMKAAPIGAIYIWYHPHRDYAIALAKKCGREDLKIVDPDWLIRGEWRGLALPAIEIDHATVLTKDQFKQLKQARIRLCLREAANVGYARKLDRGSFDPRAPS
jgi:hypothetical protein